MAKFNINDEVRVKLTDYGRRVHRQDHKEWTEKAGVNLAYFPPKEDADGWSRWQLWVLMQHFGPHMSLAGPNPFETTIEFVLGNERK